MNKNDNIALYKNLIYIRLVEELIAKEYRNGEMRCPVHLSIGQEAVAVGVSSILNKNDRVFSSHRSHAHYLAKGGNLEKMFAELMGKETGCLNGRGGSMHIQDDDVNFISSIPIVSSSIPLAMGSALQQKRTNSNNITIAYLGDGSLEEGVVFECFNFASLHKLPLIFICENNNYSCYTELSQRQTHSEFTKYAKSFGIESSIVYGNDVQDVKSAFIKVYNFSKKSNPVFIQFDTFRMLEHCGPSNDDNLNYRTDAEIEYWEKNCPVLIHEKKLIKEKIASKKELKKIENRISRGINLAYQKAKKSNLPNLSKKYIKVYS